MEKFLELVENDSSILLGRNYIQELYVYLHMWDVHSVPALGPTSHIGRMLPNLDITREQEISSAIVCITLKVPRNALKVFREIPYTELGTPLIYYILQSSCNFAGRPWQNIFSVVQLGFGKFTTTGSRYDDDFRLTIHEDEDGWMGGTLCLFLCSPMDNLP